MKALNRWSNEYHYLSYFKLINHHFWSPFCCRVRSTNIRNIYRLKLTVSLTCHSGTTFPWYFPRCACSEPQHKSLRLGVCWRGCVKARRWVCFPGAIPLHLCFGVARIFRGWWRSWKCWWSCTNRDYQHIFLFRSDRRIMVGHSWSLLHWIGWDGWGTSRRMMSTPSLF